MCSAAMFVSVCDRLGVCVWQELRMKEAPRSLCSTAMFVSVCDRLGVCVWQELRMKEAHKERLRKKTAEKV